MKILSKLQGAQRVVTLAVVSLGLAMSAAIIPSTPAFAEGPNCVNHRQHQAGNPAWGTGHVCLSGTFTDHNGTTQRNFSVTDADVLADGLCVHAEIQVNNNTWFVVAGSESCNNQGVTTPQTFVNTPAGQLTQVRIIRGPATSPQPNGIGTHGNWFAVWPD